MKQKLESIIKKYKTGAVVMGELSAEDYLEESMKRVEVLSKNGFGGVYVSFQRPFSNISSIMEKRKIPAEDIIVIDTVTSKEDHNREKHVRCCHISKDIEIDELVSSIYKMLEQVKSKNKFIFIDSMTTVTLYKPLSEVMRLSWFLFDTAKGDEENVILLFNVAKDLANKSFIKDIAMRVDEVF